MPFAIPHCTSVSGLSTVEPVSTVWSVRSAHPSIPSQTNFRPGGRQSTSSRQQPEAAGANSYQPTASVGRTPWSTKLAGIQETVLRAPEQCTPLNYTDQFGELNKLSLCAVPGGICTPEVEAPFTTVQVTCATVGCNYGGPLHHTCLQRWNSYCELKCQKLIYNQRSATAGATGTDDNQLRREPNNSYEIFEELFSLYQCPRCGQCSLYRTSSLGQVLSDDPHASMLNAIQYMNQHVIGMHSSNKQQSQDGRPLTRGSPQTSGSTRPYVSDLTNHTTQPASFLEERQQAGWYKDWKAGVTCPMSTAHQQYQIPSLKHLHLTAGTNTSYQASHVAAAALDSGLSSTAHSIDSSRRSSQNICNSETAVDMGHHDDGCWSAPPSGTRAVRRTGNNLYRSASKNDNYFNFDPLSPLQSGSPTSAVSDVFEPALENKAASSSPRQFTKQCSRTDGAEESNTSGGVIGGSSVARRYNSASGGNARGLSFWPTDKCRETPNDPSDRRKVVNRKGNIFQPRMAFNVFENLPAYKRNPYFIHLDDDSCTGNEDTRAFLLSQLTSHRVSEVYCLICHSTLIIYDHFPVIDGLFFLSPICHRAGTVSGLRVNWHTSGIAPTVYQSNTAVGANSDPESLFKNEQAQQLLSAAKVVVPPPGCLGPRQQVSGSYLADQTALGSRSHSHPPRQERYLHAICMNCMHTSTSDQGQSKSGAQCRYCDQSWSGSLFLVGALYTYDIFAASLCCREQFTCTACGNHLDVKENLSQDSPRGMLLPKSTTTQVSSSSPRGMEKTSQDTTVRQGVRANRITTPPLPFYSQYSQLITCPFCGKVDYHFVKHFERRYRT